MARLQRLIDRVFAYECIDGGRCPYLHRWRLFTFGRERNVYLHRFVGSDWSRDLHNHPKRFVSIGLWGGYVEETPHPDPDGVALRTYRAPWIRTFPAEHIHRLIMPAGWTCWTLVFTGNVTQPWGFFPDGRWVPWEIYVESDRADEAKNC